MGYNPQGHKESDTTERLTLSLSTFWGFSGGEDGKQFAYNTGDLVRSPGWGRSAGQGNGYHSSIGLPRSSVSKKSACSTGHLDLILGSGTSPGGGNGNPVQYSCLKNPMDRGAWQATVHSVAVRQD